MINYNIIISNDAQNDLVKIYNYYFNAGEISFAEEIVIKLMKYINTLDKLPKRNPIFPSNIYVNDEIRYVNKFSYIIFYVVDLSDVTIVHIVHSKMNYKSIV